MDIELESLRPVYGLFGLDTAAVMDDVKDLSILGLASAAGYIGGKQLLAKVPYIADKSPTVKGLVAIGTGFVAGIAVGKIHGSAGAGVGSGLVALGIETLMRNYMPNLAGLGDGEELLLGLGNNVDAQDWNPIPGQTDGVRDVETGFAGFMGH